MKRNIVYYVIVAVVALAIGVLGGRMLGGQSRGGLDQFQRQAMQDRQMGGQFNGKMGGGLNGNSPINGEIISMDDKSVTIKLTDGGSKIVFFSDATTVGKVTDGTIADLSVGTQVMANGTSNSDGSITAKSIQIRPAVAPSSTLTPPQADEPAVTSLTK